MPNFFFKSTSTHVPWEFVTAESYCNMRIEKKQVEHSSRSIILLGNPISNNGSSISPIEKKIRASGHPCLGCANTRKKSYPAGRVYPNFFFGYRVGYRVFYFRQKWPQLPWIWLISKNKKYFLILEDNLNTFLYNFEQCFQKYYEAVISKISKKL